MTEQQFVHLHTHTEYSLLDGAARLGDLFAEAERQGTPAVAITDHGNLHGAYDFFTRAQAAGITPIIGTEAYVAPGSRFHKKPVKWGKPSQKTDDVSGGGHYTHQTIWARNATGLHNLIQASSRAYTEGFVRKWARMDTELLAAHADGLMATTGCPSGEVQTRLRLGQPKKALAAAARDRDLFGADNYFVELMDHGLDIEKRVRDGLVDIAGQLNLPYVVTNDAHYAAEGDAAAHDALLCIQTGKQLGDEKRFKFDGTGYYLRTAAEMYALDSSEAWQAGCRTTLDIAERIDTTDMFTPANLMPRFDVPAGETEETWFRAEVARGLARRFPDGVDDAHARQADYEMGVICDKGYPAYFLVVADFIGWAKAQGIRVGPGRGSAAASLVSYALGITELDPLAHGLIFERFLNPDRPSMPDIDIDFDDRRRGDVIRYVTEKWGADKVALIATYGTIKAKAAVKDSARILGFPYAVGDKITKTFPKPISGNEFPLAGLFDDQHPRHREATELVRLYETEPEAQQVLNTAHGIEGLIRQTGVHAAGVLMSAEPITDHVPVMWREADGAIITQFDYPTCEKLGLVKMDFLGLRNLTIIGDALANIAANRGVTVDLEHVGLDDPATYQLLARGDTLAVFQLDSTGLRTLLKQMRPTRFGDIVAAVAVYRPGPLDAHSHTNYALRKNGQQDITPIHPELAEPLADILDETYGLIIYQEQVLAIAQKVAGYSMGGADELRRAMGKKKKAVLDAEYERFSTGMQAAGFTDGAVKALWEILVPFSDYAFGKAHSAAYGLIAYWTAYLKANYPAEYMAAVLTAVADNKDKAALYLNECRRMGIRVLPPDVNESEATFTPRGPDIRFGLAAVRNVGSGVVDGIAAARTTHGKFTGFEDFLTAVPDAARRKSVVESLIKAGAFDSFGHARRGLVLIHAQAVDAVAGTARNQARGQASLFDDAPEEEAMTLIPTIPDGEWDRRTALAFEREMLGLYVSDHPLFGMETTLARTATTTVAELTEQDPETGQRAHADGAQVVVGGIISAVTRSTTKAGRPMARITVEDLTGAVEMLVFPDTYLLCSEVIAEDAAVFVHARLKARDDEMAVFVTQITPINMDAVDPDRPVEVTLPEARCTPEMVARLKDVLATHPGRTPVHVHVTNGSRVKVLRAAEDWWVAMSPGLMADLKELLGPANVT